MLSEGSAQNEKQLSVDFLLAKDLLEVFKCNHAQVDVPLHRILTFLRQIPFDLIRSFGCLKLISVDHAERVSDNLLVVADLYFVLAVDDVVVGFSSIEIIAGLHVLCADDIGGGPCLEREQVSTQHHLSKVIVVVVLHH